jgi:hypothetical protein
MYDTLLFLHVLGAFAMVGATVVYWAVMLAARGIDRPTALTPVFAPANAAIAAGSLITLVFGIWLAIYLDGYEIWDGWILASLILWAASVELGRRGGARIAAGSEGGDAPLAAALRDSRTTLMLVASSVALLLILALMIWKPGA